MELKIDNLNKTYQNGVQALKNIRLNIRTGMFGLLGPNGAGKSTLMRTIATLQTADQGSIKINGIDVLNDQYKLRQLLGYLPQDFGVYPDITAVQMLDHIAMLKGIAERHQRRNAIELILEKTNLYEYRKQKLGTFSGGMKQRFGIAQALLGNPQLLIVDEPTAGLDPEERNRFHNILSEISENTIVLLSTHIVDDVSQLCHQFAIIHHGQILLNGNTSQIIDRLRGKIWQKIITKNEIADFDNRYKIILSRLFAGNILIHVLDDRQPDGFDAVVPDLEDIYFTTIKRLN